MPQHTGEHRMIPGTPPRQKAGNYGATRAIKPLGNQQKARRRYTMRQRVMLILYFLRDIGRGVEFVIAVALAMVMIALASLGAIQVYDHFFH